MTIEVPFMHFGIYVLFTFLCFNIIQVKAQTCFDIDKTGNCSEWAQSGLCVNGTYVWGNCQYSCGICSGRRLIDIRKYNPSFCPLELQPLSHMIGRWRSEFDGKVHFPTIPTFTFGEELDISICEPNTRTGANCLNFSAVAIAPGKVRKELHSEFGFFVMKRGGSEVALTTAGSNAVVTVEQGHIDGNQVVLYLQSVARASITRDLQLTGLRRTINFVDTNTIEQRIEMATDAVDLQEHSFVRYKRLFVF